LLLGLASLLAPPTIHASAGILGLLFLGLSRGPARTVSPAHAPPLLLGTKLLLCLVGLEALFLAARLWLFPPRILDALTYHLPPAVQWYHLGAIPAILETGVTRVDSMALGSTLLSLWAFTLLGHDALIELPHFLWALLLLPLTRELAGRLGVSRPWAWTCAALAFTTPAVLLQADTALDHLALGVSTLAALLCLLRWLESGRRLHLLVFALASGLMLGYKLSAPLHLGVFWLGAWWVRRGSASPHKPLLEPAPRLLPNLGLAASLSLVLGGYWYLRNLLVHGRPQGNFHHPMFDFSPGSEAGYLGYHLGLLGQNLTDLPSRLLDGEAWFSPDLPFMSGFGPQFFTFGLLGLVWTLVGLREKTARARLAHLPMLCSLALLLQYFWLYATPFSYRLYLFLPPCALAAGFAALEHTGAFRHKGKRLFLAALALGSGLWSITMTALPLTHQPDFMPTFLALPREHRTVANFLPITPAHLPYRFLANAVAADEPLAYVGGEDDWSYVFVDPAWRRRLVHLEDACLETSTPGTQRLAPRCAHRLAAAGVRLLCTCRYTSCAVLEPGSGTLLVPGLYLVPLPGEATHAP